MTDRKASSGTFCLAGFTIEDSVSLRIVYESRSTEAEPLQFVMSANSAFEGEEELKPGNRSAQIGEKIRLLLERAEADGIDLAKIDAFSVVCVGLIQDQRELIGISVTTPQSNWEEDHSVGVRVDFVDIIDAALEGKRKPLQVGVDFLAANDAKAGAEALLFLQSLGDDYVYAKIKNGVNVGVIIFGQPVIRAQHPEFGHFYPPPHDVDHEVGFPGTCKHHGQCLEGYLSSAALSARKELIAEWRELSDVEVRQTILWRQIASHYLAHLLYNVSLAFAPGHIVISRDVITQSVLDSAMSKFEELRRGHPGFRPFSKDDYVILAKSSKASDEMLGALSIAWLLATKDLRLPRELGSLRGPIPALPRTAAPQELISGPNVVFIEKYRNRKVATVRAQEETDT